MNEIQVRLETQRGEISRIGADIEEIKSKTDLKPEQIAAQVGMLEVKRNEAIKKYRKALYDLQIAGRDRLMKVLIAMKPGGRGLQIASQPGQAGFTADEVKRAITELEPEIMRTSNPDIVKSYEEHVELKKSLREEIKEHESEIVKLRAQMDEEDRLMVRSMGDNFEEAPLLVTFLFPDVAAKLCGEAAPTATTQPTNASTQTGNATNDGQATAPSPGSAASDPYNDQMLSAITEEAIIEAIQEGAHRYSNEEIWHKIRAKLNLSDMSRIPQGQRTKIYNLKKKMEEAGKI